MDTVLYRAMDPVRPGTNRPTDRGAPNLGEANFSRAVQSNGNAPIHGVLHPCTPLEFGGAVERAFLPSFALEVACRPRIVKSLERWNLTESNTIAYEDGAGSIKIHLLGEEILRSNGATELTLVRNSPRFQRVLSDETRGLLDSIARLADERQFDLFHASQMRGFVTSVPLGRLIAGVAGELCESPLTPLGSCRPTSEGWQFQWYLVEERPDRRAHLQGSDVDRIRLCHNIIAEGFQLGHYLISRPLEAVISLGARLGLMSGMSNEHTAYITSAHERDCTGELLALIVRPGSLQGWAPGLDVCWAHHDNRPRPPETLRPRQS